MNILLVGAEAAGLRALQVLCGSERRIVGVVTSDGDLARAGLALGLRIMSPDVVEGSEFAGWMRRERVDILLNVHSLHILRPEVVGAPTIGSFNLHPGPLPQYAGLMAPSWALFNGEASHAVTLHWMDDGIDTGPIAYTSEFPLTSSDTGLSVLARCVKEGIPLIGRLLNDAQGGADAISRVPQNANLSRYFGRRPPNDGCINWRWTATRIVDFVRACDYRPFRSSWGHPKARLADHDVLLLKASRTSGRVDREPGTVGAVESGSALVAAGDGWVRIHRFELHGQALPAGEVVRPGDRLHDGIPDVAA